MMAVRDGLCGCGPFPVRVAVQAGFLRGNDPSGLFFFPSWVTLSAAVTLWGRWAGDLWVCLFTLEAEVSWWHFGGRGLYSLSSLEYPKKKKKKKKKFRLSFLLG